MTEHYISIISYFKQSNISLLRSLDILDNDSYKHSAPSGALLFIVKKTKDVFALEVYPKLLQQYQIFIFKRPTTMMLFLILDISNDRI